MDSDLDYGRGLLGGENLTFTDHEGADVRMMTGEDGDGASYIGVEINGEGPVLVLSQDHVRALLAFLSDFAESGTLINI